MAQNSPEKHPHTRGPVLTTEPISRWKQLGYVAVPLQREQRMVTPNTNTPQDTKIQ